jgi:hypothetical protein
MNVYCQYSTNDYQCDVYCYKHADGGFITHIAKNRVVTNEGFPPEVSPQNAQMWIARKAKVAEIVTRAARVPLDMPRSGMTYEHDTPGEAADFLAVLDSEGYRLPLSAIEVLRTMQIEMDDTP